jgi:putative addiction module killer protein
MGPCAFVSYGLHVFCMIEVRYSAEFGKWLKGLRDANAYARIVQCIRRLERGNPGDVKSVGGGLHEARLS